MVVRHFAAMSHLYGCQHTAGALSNNHLKPVEPVKDNWLEIRENENQLDSKGIIFQWCLFSTILCSAPPVYLKTQSTSESEWRMIPAWMRNHTHTWVCIKINFIAKEAQPIWSGCSGHGNGKWHQSQQPASKLSPRRDVMPCINLLWRGAEHSGGTKTSFVIVCSPGLKAATSSTRQSQNKVRVCFLSPLESQITEFRCWISSRAKETDNKWRLNIPELLFCHNRFFSCYF